MQVGLNNKLKITGNRYEIETKHLNTKKNVVKQKRITDQEPEKNSNKAVLNIKAAIVQYVVLKTLVLKYMIFTTKILKKKTLVYLE